MYVGTRGGGLYRMRDGISEWERVRFNVY
jgi:hypothetical protein